MSVVSYDTSLRDGRQHDGHVPQIDNAVEFICRMLKLGMMVEIGFATDDYSLALFQKCRDVGFDMERLAIFGRATMEDAQAIVNMGARVATMVVKSRRRDVERSLCITLSDNLQNIARVIKFLKEHGVQVIVDLEHAVDAFFGRESYGQKSPDAEASRPYFVEVFNVCIDAGADQLVVCDTNGGGSPDEIRIIFESLALRLNGIPLGFHGHNDRGMVHANTRAAILSGAMHVQGTFDGLGERVGNLALLAFIADMQLHEGISIVSPDQLRLFAELYEWGSRIFDRTPDSHHPFLGKMAYSTLAGMHANGSKKDPGSYLPHRPEMLGALGERVVVNELSGTTGIIVRARELGVELPKDIAKTIVRDNALLLKSGVFGDAVATFTFVCLKALGQSVDVFRITEYSSSSVWDVVSGRHKHQGVVKVYIGGNGSEYCVADGQGQVDALTHALVKALKSHFPMVGNLRLVSYVQKVINIAAQESSAPVAIQLALRDDNGAEYSGLGVSPSSIEAGLQALSDAFTWFLLQSEV